MSSDPRQKPKGLANVLLDALSQRIQLGALRPGDKLPPEAALMAEYGVSRTVVREALSMLQASKLVQTRHGIGTFVIERSAQPSGVHISAEQMLALHDVIAVLELRIALETEAAALAAQRRNEENLAHMRQALHDLSHALQGGEDATDADFRFHCEIARATQNKHFSTLLQVMGHHIIPRARLGPAHSFSDESAAYLRRVQAEHQNIFEAIEAADPEAARAHMRMHLVNGRERRKRAAQALQGAREPAAGVTG